MLGSAAVAIAAVMALVTRFARARGQGPAGLEECTGDTFSIYLGGFPGWWNSASTFSAFLAS